MSFVFLRHNITEPFGCNPYLHATLGSCAACSPSATNVPGIVIWEFVLQSRLVSASIVNPLHRVMNS